MNLLESASEWLDAQRRDNLSVPIIYLPKKGGSFEIPATLGRTLFRTENQYGLTIRIESRDFLIVATDLPDDPERGDSIIYNDCRYEVLAPNGEPVWRWSGTFHSTRRIHTKEIGSVNA